MSGSYRVTVRTGPQVRSRRYPTLAEALEALAAEATMLRAGVEQEAIDARIRRFEPAEIVAARLEVAGPGRLLPAVHGGVDLHGDGSQTAWTGRVRRRELEVRANEPAAAALRRALTA